MRYDVAPLPAWAELDPSDRVRVAMHYRVPVAGDDLLVVPHGRPGWLRFPRSVDALLRVVDGMEVGGLTAMAGFPALADTLRSLYNGGLLFIGGRTGIRAEPAPVGPAPDQAGLDGDATGPGQVDPPAALLLKLTGACDLACTYCYDYDARRWPGRMSSPVARELLVECLRPGHHLTVMFHGGEPLLRFRQIQELVEFAERRAAGAGGTVSFTIQTNGLHLSGPVVDFLRTHRFTVGVSLDGPRELNDRHRVDHRGAGSFDRILATLAAFPEFMQEEVGYLSVVGGGGSGEPDAASELEAAWRFFQELGVRTWKLIPADAEGRAAGQPVAEGLQGAFVDFLGRRLGEVLDGTSDRPYLTNLVQLIEPFLSLKRANMCMKMPCGAAGDLLVLDAIGAVRACDCTYHPAFQLLPPGPAAAPDCRPDPAAAPEPEPEPARSLPIVEITAGGATESRVARSRATANAHQLRIREQWLLHDAPCASCAWLHQCAGTCPARALTHHGSLFAIDDLECATRLALFPRILADVSGSRSRLREYYARAVRAGPAAALANLP